MTLMHYAGAIMILIIIIGVGVYSGRKVKNASDFATGGRSAGTGIVAGSLIGTLVGGSSTIGTAQLAFTYGFSAWWFTLGGGIGLLILGIFYSKPLYNSKISTMPQIISREYGQKAASIAAVLMSVGTFLSIVAQLLSGIALVTSVSVVSSLLATGIIIILMLTYVLFGGVWGAGLSGIIKTILLYVVTIVCGIMSIKLAGGVSALKAVLPAEQYFNLFARGTWKDGGAGLSLVFGVLTTQTYIQAIVSAKSLKVSRAGAVTAGVLTPVIGVAGILVGMFMKTVAPDISPASVLPTFVMSYIPDFLGGVILSTLLIALVGTGAGLALGLSSMLSNDIYKMYINKTVSDKKLLLMSRIMIVVIFAAAAVFTFGNMGSMILNWSFMSMGLRGAVAFAPMSLALFAPGKVNRHFANAAIIIGPILVLAGKFILPSSIDPLFLGVGASILITLAGAAAGPRKLSAE